jgi:NAD(P)H-dependent FMN reductase
MVAMQKICIISTSVRQGRESHKAALYIRNFLREKYSIDAELIDLMRLNFPIFEERLNNLESPSPEVIEFAEKVRSAEGVILVVPEYNGGYPASVKNIIDLLTDEWRKKPVAFVVVSNGQFAGSQAIFALQFSLWKIRALTVSPALRISDIETSIDETGIPVNKAEMDKKATSTINELIWFIEARNRMLH